MSTAERSTDPIRSGENWFRPSTLEEALAIRAEHAAIPMAGATDLLVRYRRGAGALPTLSAPVLYLAHLPELRTVAVSDGVMRIGAGVTYSELLERTDTPPLLKRAIEEIAAVGLRNVGTIVGNICNASPAADAVCPLYAMDAELEVSSTGGARRLPIREFITGPGKTVLAENELVTAVQLPLGRDQHYLYRKVGTRLANALSKMSVSACATVSGGRTTSVAIALGAVAPTVLRGDELEAKMTGVGKRRLQAMREKILDGYSALIKPIDDQRSTATYRAGVTRNLVAAFIDEVLLPQLDG